ncbi:hypothetical protein STEG23_021894 [Scotinomys teguina]
MARKAGQGEEEEESRGSHHTQSSVSPGISGSEWLQGPRQNQEYYRPLFTSPSNQGSWTNGEEKSERLQDPEVANDSKETVSSGHSQTDESMNS